MGLAILDSIEAIRFDMDRYIQSQFKSTDIWHPNLSTIPLFSTHTPSKNDGTYVMIGTDHGQGTSQFMIRILLGSSRLRHIHNRPDFNSRDINYATIKCRKDPYEILKLTSDETQGCIKHLNTHKLIALSDDSSLIRCIFVNVDSCYYSIVNNILTASGPGIEDSSYIH